MQMLGSGMGSTSSFTDGAVLRLSQDPPFGLLCICYIYNNIWATSSGKYHNIRGRSLFERQIVTITTSDDHPLAHTQATKMFAEAVARKQKQGISQKDLAAALGHKSSVVVSHMATGRAPIPIDRSRDISDLLELDRNVFLLAVLEQRLPMLDFQSLVGSRSAADGKHEHLINQSETIGGRPLSALPDDLLDLIKECVADKDPRSRWLSLDELPVVALIRQLRPTFRSQGLTQADQKKVLEALR